MTQAGIALDFTNRKWEDIPSLKRHLRAAQKGTIREYVREVPQLTTDSAVEVEEKAGETIDAMAANKVLNVWTAADVAADRNKSGTIEWQDVNGDVTEATFTTDASNSSTKVAVVSPVTTARYIRSVSFEQNLGAQDLLVGNVAGDEIFAAIKTGQHQLLKTGYMCPTTREGYLGAIEMELPVASDGAITLVVTYTPYGHTISTTKTIILKAGENYIKWEPCYRLAAATKVTMTIQDAATEATVTVIAKYIEAY